ncbi:putative Auxin response factor [Hibiscus syriacus]|uniref:Auxin response factor n=1 Tax=Hibiscus syriacus TaxID=106335 RepID=A0A6A3CPZ0_HIBSY|nr:putative Auxin response factor [Hibiscus syriacus]
MGSVSLKIGDGTARFKRATLCSSAVNILMFFSIIITNLFALYAFTYSPKQHITNPFHHPHKNFSLISQHVSLIMKEIDSFQRNLAQMEKELLGYDTLDLSRPNLATELKLFLQHHQIPLGKDSRTGITEMVASVGHSCEKSTDLLSQYMSYKVSGPCPDDWSLAQKLILRGCEPLPRRRCFAKTVPKVGLTSLPASLWKPVGEKILTWSGLNRSKNDFLIDDVLAMWSGGIRIGFDIGGLFPLFLSLDHMFPFYDNVFDLVHATTGLDVGDNFHCSNVEKKRTLTRLIERFGYKKLKWVIGEKIDAGWSGKPELYLSAVLQKPVRI